MPGIKGGNPQPKIELCCAGRFDDYHIGIGLDADILQLGWVFASIAVPGSHDPAGLLPGTALPSIGKFGGCFLLRQKCILVLLANFMRDQPIDIGLHDPLVFRCQFIQSFQLAWIGLVKFEVGDRFLYDCSAP